MVTRATSLQGTKMLSEPSLGVEGYIREFIKLRLINKSVPWADRRSPLN